MLLIGNMRWGVRIYWCGSKDRQRCRNGFGLQGLKSRKVYL